MAVLFFRARRGSAAAGSTSEAASTSQLGVTAYPCMLSGNRLIFSSNNSGNFNLADLDVVIVSAGSGECSLSFEGPIVVQSWQEVKLHHSSVSVAGHEVECIDNFEEREVVRNKRRSLVLHVPKLLSEEKPPFVEIVRAAGTASDSGDDEPPDKAILPAFNEKSMLNIHNCAADMWIQFKRAVNKKFSNGPGKFFAHTFARFLLNILPEDQQCRFESSLSTTLGGGGGRTGDIISIKDSQAGSASVMYVFKKRPTRNEAEKMVVEQKTRYADVSVYCHTLNLYCICGEIKSDEEDIAEGQNMEQLLGLWRPNQKFMLGWTLNPRVISIRLLIRSRDKLVLYEVQYPNDEFGLLNLAKLYMAVFLTIKLGD